MTIDVIDPATGRRCGTIARSTEGDVDVAVQAANAAFVRPEWRRMAAAERGRLLSALASVIRSNEEELAVIEASDVGKPKTQALADVRGAARYFEYYGGMVDKIEGTTIPVRWGALDLTIHEPYGVCAHIIPWNFPLAMGARGIAPALAAGNTVVAKPAEDASLSLLKLAELAKASGFPDGVFTVVTGYGNETGAALVRHPLVAHVTFTGSKKTGSEIMKVAGEQVKPVALELGGKAPAIVFEDADLDAAARIIAWAALVNAGQVCNSCSRVVADRRIAERLQEKLVERFAATRLGAPLTDPDMGPVNSARQFEKIESAVRMAASEGANVLRLAKLPSEPDLREGFFVQPTLLGSVTPAQAAFREEIFGPVLTLTTFDDVDEAVSLANATEYGLNAGVFTKDVGVAMNVAHRVEAGQVYINGWGTGGGVEVPFGGFKKSGFSREKGFEGLKHYLQVKAITVHFP